MLESIFVSLHNFIISIAKDSEYSKSKFFLDITILQSMRSIACNHAKRVRSLQLVAVWNWHCVAYGIKPKKSTLRWCHTHKCDSIQPNGWCHTNPSAWINKTVEHRSVRLFYFGDPYGNRTHVTAVKGPCLNRLTNGPWVVAEMGFEPMTCRVWTGCSSHWAIPPLTLTL